MAAMLQSLGVGKGDRVLIYMPMIAEACFAMLACARIGAIHSVVFGGFASGSLATRIDDAKPKVMVTSDAGMRGGKAVPYKHLVDEACSLAQFPPAKVLIIDRGLDKDFPRIEGRDLDYATLRAQHMDAKVPVTWLESSEPSYILYTSGTTGKPKGVQRDTGGYAVALAASMKQIYCGAPGETMLSTSDIGWVVGHSYIIYGPLIAGMATIMYEGTPIRPDAGIWWRIVEKYKVNVMFSAPTAIRVLKKQDPAFLHKYDLSSLRHLFLAGEPLDEPTHRWIMGELNLPVIDHYWQTETGWPMLGPAPGIEKTEIKFGSPAFPVDRLRPASSSTKMARSAGPTRRGSSRSFRRCRRAAYRRCGARTIASSRPISLCSRSRWSTRPSTGAFAMTMATTSSSAAPTTSSTSPAIDSAHARSRKLCRPTPASPKWPWSASPINSRARYRSLSPWSRMHPRSPRPRARRRWKRRSWPRWTNCSAPSRAPAACISSAGCPRPAQARCCGARSRHWPRDAIRAT